MMAKKAIYEMTEEQAFGIGITPEQLAELRKMQQQGSKGNRNPLTEEEERKRVGALLAKIREDGGLTQREVADNLGYKGHNFIYLVERGKSKVPANKIDDFVRAYDADVKLSSALIRAFHPEMWRSTLIQMHILAGIDYGKIDQQVHHWIDEELKK